MTRAFVSPNKETKPARGGTRRDAACSTAGSVEPYGGVWAMGQRKARGPKRKPTEVFVFVGRLLSQNQYLPSTNPTF
jgi:hypothetical protein